MRLGQRRGWHGDAAHSLFRHGRRMRQHHRCGHAGTAAAHGWRGLAQHLGRQVLDRDDLGWRHDGQPVADVLQLAHVAGKGERLQPLHGIDPHALGLHAQLPRALLQEVACQHGHVFVALAQRGQAQADDVEAVEQILAEGAVAHALLQVLVGGGDDAHMCLDGLVAAHAVEMPVRQHTQQARLQVERHVADFIEKERAALGLLEAAAPLGLCAREGAALVAEQLGLQQVLGDGGGVDGHEGAARHGRVLVQRARHQFLARARLARDQHRDLALAEPADGAKDVLHGRRLAQHLGLQRGLCLGHVLAQAFLDGAADELHRLGQVEGFGQVLEGSALEGRDGTVQVGVRGHDDDGQAGLLGADLLEQFQAGAAGHADIADQHLWWLARRVAGIDIGQCREHVARLNEAARCPAFPAQCLFQHEADGRVIIHDPDRFHWWCFLPLLQC